MIILRSVNEPVRLYLLSNSASFLHAADFWSTHFKHYMHETNFKSPHPPPPPHTHNFDVYKLV